MCVCVSVVLLLNIFVIFGCEERRKHDATDATRRAAIILRDYIRFRRITRPETRRSLSLLSVCVCVSLSLSSVSVCVCVCVSLSLCVSLSA